MSITIESVTAFFGWCAVVNSAVLLVFTVVMLLGHHWIAGIHAKLFSLPESTIRAHYYSFLANYKLIILTLNVVPYIACKLIV